MCGVHLAVLLRFGFLLLALGLCDGKECLKDKDLASYPVNVYYCTDPDKTECCVRNKQPTCCEPDLSRHLREQLVLWGSVITIVSVAVTLLLCWKRDTYICEGATLKDRAKAMCRCRKQGEMKFPEEAPDEEQTELQTFKPLAMDRVPTPGTSSLQSTSLQADKPATPRPYSRGRTSAMSAAGESLSDDCSDDVESEIEVRETPVKERRSWTLSDKLPPLVGARRPPTAEPLPSTSRMRPLNDILM